MGAGTRKGHILARTLDTERRLRQAIFDAGDAATRRELGIRLQAQSDAIRHEKDIGQSRSCYNTCAQADGAPRVHPHGDATAEFRWILRTAWKAFHRR